MRTTLAIDDDLLSVARTIATSRNVPIGQVISELARKGLSTEKPLRRRGGFPVFDVPADAPIITPDHVRQALEDE